MDESQHNCRLSHYNVTLSGKLHLFEHRVSDFAQFWHGIFESDCDDETISMIYEMSVINSPRIHLTLEDGRQGTAYMLDSKETAAGIQIALAGVSKLWR